MAVVRLYELCLDRLCGLLLEPAFDPGPHLISNLASRVADDLLERAVGGGDRWDDRWAVFLTPNITRAVLRWDERLIRTLAHNCKKVRRVLFRGGTGTGAFDPALLQALPRTVACVDLDGELHPPPLPLAARRPPSSWLHDAHALFKALSGAGAGAGGAGGCWLSEVHLGGVSATADQLLAVLTLAPGIRLLRHYQLVAALYRRHHADPAPQPVYKLTNLDADFSHVVRRRMSPSAVLGGDALRVAAALCPAATSVRVRVDCSTPHDVFAPLATALARLRELSVVCVTSGERSNLDFSDLVPVLEAHGPTSLRVLELKVLEEVDAHQVVSLCPRLESLVLSGCGFLAPPSPCQPACHRPAPCPAPLLPRLRLLFYADGDDFSWTHNVPQCFWKATLSPGKRSRLSGLFLESPHIGESTAALLWPAPAPATPTPLYPRLAALSLCRCPDITLDQVRAMTGGGGALRYLRASDCQRLHPKRLRQMFANTDAALHTD